MTHCSVNDDVVRHLYEAAAGLRTWADALARLHHEINASGLQLVVVDKSEGRLVTSEQPISAMVPDVVDGTLDHVREYHRHDPHMQHVVLLPIGSVMHSAAVFPRAQWSDHLFYREFWSAYKVRELLAAKVAEGVRYVTMIGVNRTYDLPAYSQDEIDLFDRYVKHLVTAYRITTHLGALTSSAQAGLTIMESSTRPMILIDAELRIVMRNKLATNLLHANPVLYEDNGYLCCHSRIAVAELRRGLSEVGIGYRDVQINRRLALRLKAPPARHGVALCSLWAIQPAATMCAFGASPVALLTIVPDTSTQSVDRMFLASMFDLTPAEANIAVGLVEGVDLHGIANSQHVCLETIRTQLKSVFAKTGVHRQAELVALLYRATAY